MPKSETSSKILPLHVLAKAALLLRRANDNGFHFLKLLGNGFEIPKYNGFNTSLDFIQLVMLLMITATQLLQWSQFNIWRSFMKVNLVSVHHRNIRLLAIESYKAKNNLSSQLMLELFQRREVNYNIRKWSWFEGFKISGTKNLEPFTTRHTVCEQLFLIY